MYDAKDHFHQTKKKKNTQKMTPDLQNGQNLKDSNGQRGEG